MLQGIWLSRDRSKNRDEIELALALARSHPDVIEALIVGNETLLRGELSIPQLKKYIGEVRQRSGMPVTYADVWEFWLKASQLVDAIDFVTIHILPYWEDDPVAADDVLAHVRAVRHRITEAFPHKEIFIGEVGWPSAGRMRGQALPSPVNQARVLTGCRRTGDARRHEPHGHHPGYSLVDAARPERVGHGQRGHRRNIQQSQKHSRKWMKVARNRASIAGAANGR